MLSYFFMKTLLLTFKKHFKYFHPYYIWAIQLQMQTIKTTHTGGLLNMSVTWVPYDSHFIDLSVGLITGQRTIYNRRHMTHDDGRKSIPYCTWRKWRKKKPLRIYSSSRDWEGTLIDRTLLEQDCIWMRRNYALYVLSFYVHYMRLVH